MKKTCILFGAGAEINYGIKGGKDFALKVVGIGTNKIDDVIKTFYLNLYNNIENKNWVKNIEYSTLKDDKLYQSSLRKKYLTEYLNNGYKITKTDLDNQIKQEIKNMDDTTKQLLLDEYISYMDILDEKFHCIISPAFLGPIKFWNIVYCYTRAYLTIMEDLSNLCKIENRDYLYYLEKPKEALHEISKSIIDKENTYYHIVSEYTKENNNLKIITTNYTPLCQLLTGVSEDNITYVHGKLGLFEAPYSLKVYDAEKEELPIDEIYFPYLFVQSGVKPIVDSYQINAFYKMNSFLNECDILIIIGYRINIDDNHLNGLIRNLCSNKEIIFLDYDDLGETTIRKLLRLDNKNILKYKSINTNNCNKVFKEVLYEKI